MTPDVHARNKAALAAMRRAQYDYEPGQVLTSLRGAFLPDALVHLSAPFEDLDGAQGLYDTAYAPLHRALPDLERRDTIVMAGASQIGRAHV